MAKELELKYGCNPNQKPARIFMQEGELPIEVLNGRPGYINFMDALNGWQLVKELEKRRPVCLLQLHSTRQSGGCRHRLGTQRDNEEDLFCG